MKLGSQAVALHRKASILRDERLPGQGPGALKQLLKAPGGKAPQADQHPGAQAQIQVEPGDVPGPAGAQYPAVFRPHLPEPQLLHLPGYQTFRPQQGGNNKPQ